MKSIDLTMMCFFFKPVYTNLDRINFRIFKKDVSSSEFNVVGEFRKLYNNK